MKSKNHLHPIQTEILRTMLFKTKARFRDLNINKVSTDHFSFHLRQLMSGKLLEKVDGGWYQLTNKGKEFANRLDTDRLEIEKQPKLTVLLVVTKKEAGMTKFLTQTRLKHPFYGFKGFVCGKVRWGEKSFNTAMRELKEETGLTGNLKIVGIEHKTDFNEEAGEILEDKFFFVFHVRNTKGKLIKKFEGGKNSWLSEEEIMANKKVFEDVPKILKGFGANKFFFFEDSYYYNPKDY